MENWMEIHAHHHDWGQLVFSISGVVRVNTPDATFLLPPSRALWIPPLREHAVTAVERADLRTLYLHQAPGADAQAGSNIRPDWLEPRVLEVTPLLRELVLQMARLNEPSATPPASATVSEPREHWIASLILDELQRAKRLRLGVDLPQDKRLTAPVRGDSSSAAAPRRLGRLGGRGRRQRAHHLAPVSRAAGQQLCAVALPSAARQGLDAGRAPAAHGLDRGRVGLCQRQRLHCHGDSHRRHAAQPFLRRSLRRALRTNRAKARPCPAPLKSAHGTSSFRLHPPE